MELWKIKREAQRFKQQIASLPELITEPIANRRHDARIKSGLFSHEGDIPFSDRIAIYLIYQPNGVSDSVLDTCAHLVSKGYAPFVISNAEVSPGDRAKLKGVTWKLMQRPNFGHDFGGYRDAVLSLFSLGLAPDFLCIINDSIWFPLYKNESLIEECEAQTDSVSGTILRGFGENQFLESYFYIVPKAIYTSGHFRNFWTTYKLTSNKYKVIRRGERGFSKAMTQGGTKLNPVFPVQSFLEGLETQSDSFLRDALRYAAFPDRRLNDEKKKLLQSQHAGWRLDALNFIKSNLPKRLQYSAFPYAMTKITRYPILKKSNDPAATLWRSAMLQAWDNGDLSKPRDVVLSEVRNSLNK